jgi:hypothetical protein
MAKPADVIQIPNLDKEFVARRNRDGHWLLGRFHENIILMNKLAGSLPRKMPWQVYSVEGHNAVVSALQEKGLLGEAYRFHWQEMLDHIQAFGLLSAWRQTELASSAMWALRRNDPLCAALLSRAAIETTAKYAWFMSQFRPPLVATIVGKKKPVFTGLFEAPSTPKWPLLASGVRNGRTQTEAGLAAIYDQVLSPTVIARRKEGRSNGDRRRRAARPQPNELGRRDQEDPRRARPVAAPPGQGGRRRSRVKQTLAIRPV